MPVKQKTNQKLLVEAREKFAKKDVSRKMVSTYDETKKVTFDELLMLFSSDCQTFTLIAKKYQCSNENVRRIYKKYFAKFFSRRPNGHKRRAMCTLKKRTLRKREVVEREPEEHFAEIVSFAKQNGLEVKRVPLVDGNYFNTARSSLRISNKICGIHVLAHLHIPNRSSKRIYTAFNIRRGGLEKIAFQIILQRIPEEESRIYIIPSSILLKEFGEKQSKIFYLPVGESLYKERNLYRKTDFKQFIGAWHLLKDDQKPIGLT